MASSSKQKTAEELSAQQAGYDEQAKAMNDRRQVTLVGADGLGSSRARIGGGYDNYDNISRGGTYAVNNDDRGEYIDIGGAKAYWNADKGNWQGTGQDSSGGNHNGASFMTSDVAAPQAIGAPTVAPEAPKDWRDDIDDSKSAGPEGMTTDQIVDNAGMDNWMQMGPQTAGQHINALVDPANWQHQVDPQYQQTRNLGRYINPLLDEQMNYRKKKGLLDYAKLSGGLV